MRGLRAYPEYKEVSSRWFNEIPVSWDAMREKWLFSNKKDRADKSDEQLAASQKYGVVPQRKMIEMNNANVMLALKGIENFKKVRENDFVVSLRSFEGGIEHSQYAGCISPAYTVLRRRVSDVDPSYFKYALKCSPFTQALNSTSEGIRDGKTITYDEFGNLVVAQPLLEDQVAIGKYLDRETARIDNLIAEKQNFIKLLKEKRQALISHVVTKGLDPNVKMKDSGVEWVGEVPEHWDMSKVRWLTRTESGGTPSTQNHEKYYEGGSIPCSKLLPEFLHLFVEYCRLFWMLEADGARKDPNINQDIVKNLPVPVTSLNEQSEIVGYFNSKVSVIEMLVTETSRSTELLREHRTALISAAVTGKIDVRKLGESQPC